MSTSAETRKPRSGLIEVACIASIVVVALMAEVSFGVYSTIAAATLDFAPWMRSYALAIFASLWLGFYVYSYARKRELGQAIRQLQDTEQAFEDYKISDPVTGLPNRAGFELVSDQRLKDASGHNFVMLAIEVTNMEAMAVVHSREAANEMMMRLADSVFLTILPTDYVACTERYFYLFSADLDPTAAQARMDAVIGRTMQQAAIGHQSANSKLHPTLAFALMDIGEPGKLGQIWSGREVLHRLDFLLHAARRNGHGAIKRYGIDIEEEMTRRTIIEACLGDAIHNQEIVPHFQPLIDLSGGNVAGVEVLARWTHPMLGTVAPVEFIPIAEETGLLRSMTLSLVRQACRAAKTWPSDIKLAFNISPSDLRDEMASDALLDVLDETGIDKSRIELEITENALIEQVDAVNRSLTKFKEHGISIAIDDFGTGYSSLFHLRSLPFDKIKIDQSFVRDMDTCAENQKIVRTIIALAQSLGLKTTAEGIEGEECEAMLNELGCSIGQGYLFARALPASEIGNYIADFTRDQGASMARTVPAITQGDARSADPEAATAAAEPTEANPVDEVRKVPVAAA